MVSINRASCAGYGAYELKATYQRNLLLGMLITTLLAAGAASLAVLLQGLGTPTVVLPRDKHDVTVIIPPPFDIKSSDVPKAGGQTSPIEQEGVIPEPVVDSLLSDDSPLLPTNDEKAIMVGLGEGVGEGTEEGLDEGIPSWYDDDPLPERGKFVAAEIQPELIYSILPEYPRLMKKARIEGRVEIQALVGKEGDVLDAVVFVSSGNTLLDAAALAVAWKYKYRPAIQNGRPLAIWVTYKVEFKLAH